MSLRREQLADLAALASDAAAEAGRYIAGARPSSVEHKPGGGSLASEIVTEIDRHAEAIILERLAPSVEALDLGLLSEEQPDSGARHHKPYFWCIDPLDGTLPYVEGKPGYAVSIALVSRDGVPMLGAIYDPARDISYRAARGLGFSRNDAPWRPEASGEGRLSVFLDRSALASEDYPPILDALPRAAESLGLDGVDVRIEAGGVMNACLTLESAPACYFKLPKPTPGGGSLWDFAATACLFGEAGAIATDFAGDRLDLNRADSTYMNHRGVFFATDPRIPELVRRL